MQVTWSDCDIFGPPPFETPQIGTYRINPVCEPWEKFRLLGRHADRLVRNSSGYFIYVSTVVEFVDNEHSRLSKQLNIIQIIQILLRVPSRHRPRLGDILCFILYYPADSIVIEDVEALLGLECGEVPLILHPCTQFSACPVR
jgi:hypothetical protein